MVGLLLSRVKGPRAPYLVLAGLLAVLLAGGALLAAPATGPQPRREGLAAARWSRAMERAAARSAWASSRLVSLLGPERTLPVEPPAGLSVQDMARLAAWSLCPDGRFAEPQPAPEGWRQAPGVSPAALLTGLARLQEDPGLALRGEEAAQAAGYAFMLGEAEADLEHCRASLLRVR